MSEDLALGFVLETLSDPEAARVRELLATDASFTAEVERARSDLTSLARGIELVALRGVARTPRRWKSSAVAALVAAALAVVGIAVVGIAVVLASRGGRPPVREPAPSLAVSVPGAADVSKLVKDSSVIVIGTVSGVREGTMDGEGGLSYQIAEIDVSETIKGDAGPRVAAFDYTYGAPWSRKGQKVLLFLVSSEGTANASVKPSHLQVLNGDAGSYEIRGGVLGGASFSLDDVRRLARNG